MTTLIQDSRTIGTLSQDTRASVGTLTQDSRNHIYGRGKILGAFLHPIYMKSGISANTFTIDIRP